MKQETDRIDASLLDRYLAGECTAEEETRAREWIQARPERQRLVATLRGERGESGAELEAAWDRLTDRLSLGGRARAVRPRRPGLGLLRIAAAVLILLGGALVWRQWAPLLAGGAPDAYAMERSTAVGESTMLRLSDGTRVTLAPASRLRVREGYGDGAREVELEGEGLFSVAHDPERPFRVHAGGATTEVLGTEFSVRAVAGGGARVVVASGRVGLRSAEDAKGLFLDGGDLGMVGDDGRITAERGVDVARYLAWSTGRLLFEDAPLARVLDELERWYQVDLVADDPALAARPLTATFLVGQPLDEVLASVTLAMNARVERQGSTLRLAPLP